jgi:anti-sigma factor RsiW
VSHPGPELSAFVDGELDHDARDRVLNHLAGCPGCRADVEAERRLKARLAATASPAVPADLSARLRAIAEPGEPLPPWHPPMPGGSRPAVLPAPGRRGSARPRSRRPAARPGADGRSRRTRVTPRRLALAASGALTAGGVLLSGAFLLGSAPRPEPGVRVSPAVDRLAVEHSRSRARMPLSDPTIALLLLRAGAGGDPAARTSGR